MVCDILVPTGGQASDNKDTAPLSSDPFLFKGVWLHRSATNPCGVEVGVDLGRGEVCWGEWEDRRVYKNSKETNKTDL